MNLDLAIAFLLSSFIGLSLGLLGSGGTIITLPVLVYVAGIPVAQSVTMSLAVVGGTSLVGSVLQWQRGFFDVRAAAIFAIAGMNGAFVGTRFTHAVSSPLLLVLFAMLMLIAGINMFKGPREIERPTHDSPWLCAVAGAGVGLLTGFLGVGGGFLIVPALALFGGLDMKKSVGTSLGVIALNSMAGLAGHLRFVRVDWGITLGFLACATVGMVFGVLLAGRLSEFALWKTFAWFVLAVAVVIGWKNGMALLDR